MNSTAAPTQLPTALDDEQAAKLVEAFHLIYDVKDALAPGCPAAYAAYEAIEAIKGNLRPTDIPKRRDGDGRADGDSLVVPYEEVPNVLGALRLAAQVTAATGDRVTSGEYAATSAKLTTKES